jgi:hypothetical protein
MGPHRLPEESVSAYRFRYSRYCLVWFLCLGAALAALFAVRPSIEGSTAMFAAMFFLVGLPLGATTALVAAVGFAVGGGWAALVDRNSLAAHWWPKFRETLRVLVLSPLVVFGLYMFSKGLMTLEVLFPSRRNHFVVHWATEPLWFIASLCFWGGVAVALAIYLLRHLRLAYATSDRGSSASQLQ